MYDLFDLIEALLKVIVSGFIILFVIAIPIALMELNYIGSSYFDESEGVVFCNGEIFYTGKLYKFSKNLDTDNLQSPIFSVRISDKLNFLKTEKRAICEKLEIKKL